MSSNEVNVASAALAIAVVALVIAAGQLLQQLFGTADGYRRCQRSVIGGWSKLVRRRFMWSSFRLEVRVTTPHFEICPLDKAQRLSMRIPSGISVDKDSTQRIAITGSDDSRRRTFSRAQSSPSASFEDDEDEDAVSWSLLLVALHNRQQLQLMNATQALYYFNSGVCSSQINPKQYASINPKNAILCVNPKTRSWDLMPPDVVRPVASTTLGTLISMAHRMGMVWVDLIPREGKLRAEGFGQSLSATLMRGMGIVVEYNVEPSLRPTHHQTIYSSLYVPSSDADKMACGIIPGNELMHTYDIHVRSGDHDPDTKLIAKALGVMGVGNPAIDAISQSVHHANSGHHWPAFVDLLGMWSDWLPFPETPINSVLSPVGHRIYTMGEAYEARVVWRWILQEQEAPSVFKQRVLQFYNAWALKEPRQFYGYYKLTGNALENRKSISFFKSMYDETTVYFSMLFGTKTPFYTDLVASHINANAHSLRRADEHVKAGTSRNDGRVGRNLWDTLFTERAFIYVDNIPEVVEFMRLRHDFSADVIEDAWWMLMLRAQCWEMGVDRIVQKSCVPSSYYNSPTRVYIL
ncbi:hypothetical protein P153DRAFT_432186 [Dothidotthia symphoricarpi CBS 119687]|uniref:Uncharacterized protein n=1 Tax=Dothidotthia symphoricarpi CBS 119687 TaxID=1392245 RepID=A0A6A6ACU2_9PLEO|nr:uncharacterized protein P153DRAFT_432186 [Dothidotthia symphoricarpi CBS 119687]KAF2128561.1 hypothetical protein P153DRAFT_432186 [Dothidotthia symphoricarpi CBS 119687]